MTSEAILDKKIAQSKAESPPPEITTFLSRYNSGSLIIYSTPLSSKSAILGIKGFLGSKLPKPPAIATIFAWCFVPLLVVTINVSSSCFSIVSALSPKVKPGSNCLLCSISFCVKSPAKISGYAGIS